MTPRWATRALPAVAFVLAAAGPDALEAQGLLRREMVRTPEGIELDFHPDGVWRKRARDVAAERARLLGGRNYQALNAPLALGAAGVPAAVTLAAVSGTLRVPTVLFRFQDNGTGAAYDSALYRQVLYGDPPLNPRPYSITTLYREMSNGLLAIDGRTLGWVTLDSAEATYTGPPGGCTSNPFGTENCNGIFGIGFTSLQVGLREALGKLDPMVDFGLFDSDGADGAPNSGDDDGFVDLVVFVHSERDGACVSASNNHIWAHRSSALSGFASNDPAANGGLIRFRDYTIQAGVGGAGGCDSTQVMAIGTTAHETGHALGLPDLYDTSQETEGVGEWDLMGAGNWSTQQSPTRMSAWSLNRLGWVALQEISASGSYTLAPATLDTALLVRPPRANPRGEYLLLENRQPLESDSAMIRVHCGRSGASFPSACGGGLAVWHIDSTKLASGGGVNAGPIHGVALRQADGLNNLRQAPQNRGDAGDLWPGVTRNTRFSYRTAPAAQFNAGGFMGFELDSIAELPDGRIAFRLEVGGLTTVEASESSVMVRVDGTSYQRFEDVLEPGSVHTVDVDSLVTSTDGRTRRRFESWSDGGARSHEFTATVEGDSLVAAISTSYRVRVTSTGSGTIATTPAGTDDFYDHGTTVSLVARPATGFVFDRWQGDLTSLSDSIALSSVTRPYDLEARFLGAPAVLLDRVVDHLLGVATTLTTTDERYFDLIGNGNNRFDVGDFLAWLDVSDAVGSVAAARDALRALAGVDSTRAVGDPPPRLRQ